MSVKERWIKTKPIKYSIHDAINKILSKLLDSPQIWIVYLFGSSLKDKNKSASDIDVAIYTSSDFSWQDYYLLYGELTKALHSDRIDLVWLNRADPILKFEIIKNGKVLYFKEADLLNDFELKAKKNYYDYVIYLNKRRRSKKE